MDSGAPDVVMIKRGLYGQEISWAVNGVEQR